MKYKIRFIYRNSLIEFVTTGKKLSDAMSKIPNNFKSATNFQIRRIP